MRLTDRDFLILNCLAKFNFMLGRHIKKLFFDGTRACDRRLKLLCENEYMKHQKILYGIPSLYALTHKGKKTVNASLAENKIRVEQIPHDIAVIDTVIYILNEYGIALSNVTTEKQLHQLDGFGVRKHHPDFIFENNNQTVVVEIELTLKAKARLEKNITANFMNYDYQIWIVPNNQLKILKILGEHKQKYIDMKIISLEEVQNYVRSI